MADLKERLSRVEGFTPPDLWSKIESQASTPESRPEQDRVVGATVGSQQVLQRRLPDARRRLAVIGVAFVLTAASLYGVVVAFHGIRQGSGAPPARNGLIAYVGQATGSAHGIGNLDIFTVDSTTGAMQDLTPTPNLAEDQAAWTPDGSKVAFVGEVGVPLTKTRSTFTDSLYAMNADGSDLRELPVCAAGHCGIADPAWSPDATRIAFVDSSDKSLMVYDLGSGALSTICDAKRCGGGIAQPAWSPDGTRIAFSNFGVIDRTGPGPVQSAIWVGAADGSLTQRLTPGPAARGCQLESLGGCYFDVFPAWSPDGSTIAFTSVRDDCQFAPPDAECWRSGDIGEHFDIWTIGADGTNLRRVTPEFGQFVAWSPDGRYLLISGAALFVVRPDGTGRREIRTPALARTLGGIPDWR